MLLPKLHRSEKVVAQCPLNQRKAYGMKITTIGIDLAKKYFRFTVGTHGKAVLREQLGWKPAAVHTAGRESWVNMGIKSSSCHQFVKPYVKTNKRDMADAEAICKAVN